MGAVGGDSDAEAAIEVEVAEGKALEQDHRHNSSAAFRPLPAVTADVEVDVAADVGP